MATGKGRIMNKLSLFLWNFEHKRVRKIYRYNYCGDNPTIISCNCIGGILYHELGLQFLSPTINLYMNCEDFIKFCEHLNYYLSLSVTEYCGEIKRSYPMGILDDIVLYFVHYQTFQEASKKWEVRKKRMNMNNIFIIASDRDGFNKELLERFSKLPYKNKKFFSHLPYENYEDVIYIKGFENKIQIEGLSHKTKHGHYLIDQFDWVNWLSNR